MTDWPPLESDVDDYGAPEYRWHPVRRGASSRPMRAIPIGLSEMPTAEHKIYPFVMRAVGVNPYLVAPRIRSEAVRDYVERTGIDPYEGRDRSRDWYGDFWVAKGYAA